MEHDIKIASYNMSVFEDKSITLTMFDASENEMQCKNIMQTLKVSWLRKTNFLIGLAYPKHIFVVNQEA